MADDIGYALAVLAGEANLNVVIGVFMINIPPSLVVMTWRG